MKTVIQKEKPPTRTSPEQFTVFFTKVWSFYLLSGDGVRVAVALNEHLSITEKWETMITFALFIIINVLKIF